MVPRALTDHLATGWILSGDYRLHQIDINLNPVFDHRRVANFEDVLR